MSFDFIDRKFAQPKPAFECSICEDTREDCSACYCHECENGGWVMSAYQEHPPNFEVCQKCHNPLGLRSP